jgi:predicted phosphodiesterase
MDYILLSDIHATSKQPVGRNDDIVKAFFRKFTFILRLAKQRDAAILQAGDFFHRPRDWHLLFRMMALLKRYDVKIYTVYGQHDTYLYADIDKSPTTLGILLRAGMVQLLGDKPAVRHSSVHIYGCSWGMQPPEPENRKLDTNILVIHAPISDIEVFPGHKYFGPKAFIRKHKGYDLIVAGDTHRQILASSGMTQLVNTGPMLRLEATGYNMEHHPCTYIYNTDNRTLEKIEIPHADADEVLSRGHLEDATHMGEILQDFIESLKEGPTIGIKLKDSVHQYIEDNKVANEIKQIISGVMGDESK